MTLTWTPPPGSPWMMNGKCLKDPAAPTKRGRHRFVQDEKLPGLLRCSRCKATLWARAIAGGQHEARLFPPLPESKPQTPREETEPVFGPDPGAQAS